jgi:hypothetical protein
MLLAILLFSCLPSHAATTETKGRVFYSALSKDSASFLFKSRRIESKGVISIDSTYTDMQGKPLISEEVDLDGDRPLRYSYNQFQVDDFGDAQFVQKKVQMTFKSSGETSKDSEDFDPTTVVAPMVQPLLQKHWDEFMKGDSIHVRYLAIERVETIGFKLFKDEERVYKGKPAVDILMKPSSFIIAALVSPIRITVMKEAPHWILESEGRLAIRWPKRIPPYSRDDWKAIDARVEYDIPVTIPDTEIKPKTSH